MSAAHNVTLFLRCAQNRLPRRLRLPDIETILLGSQAAGAPDKTNCFRRWLPPVHKQNQLLRRRLPPAQNKISCPPPAPPVERNNRATQESEDGPWQAIAPMIS